MVHSYIEGELLFSSRNKIYRITDLTNPQPEVVGVIPWKAYQRISTARIFDRYFKHSILQVHRTKRREYLVSTGNTWWHIDSKGNVFLVEKFSETRPMNRGICESAKGITFVAEYISNPERSPVKIFRSEDLRTFDIAWEFNGARTIRHVHALVRDPELENRIWVLTGDLDDESHFYYTDDDFNSLNCFLSDGQKSRAVDLIIRDGSLYWGMDSPSETPYVLSVKKESPDYIEKLFELPGPAYYQAQNEAGGIYLGISVEKRFTTRGLYGYVYGLRPDNSWREILHCRKNIFPEYGIFYFPKGILPDNFVVFSQKALLPYEGFLTIARDNAWN